MTNKLNQGTPYAAPEIKTTTVDVESGYAMSGVSAGEFTTSEETW